MKRLILIRGPMGVGKTAVSRELQKRLSNCALLDGDWCWDIRPFAVDDETKAMVLDNIRHILTGYLRCTSVENIVFCWVMQDEEIVEAVLHGLPLTATKVHRFTLLAAPEALASRIQSDVSQNLRTPDALPRALRYLPKYAPHTPETIDTTSQTPAQTAEALLLRLYPINRLPD